MENSIINETLNKLRSLKTSYHHISSIQMGRRMSQKLLVNGFEWVKELLKLNKDFIKNHDENSNKRYILEIDVEYPKSSFNLRKDLPI